MTAPTVQLAPLPKQRFTDSNGNPLTGGLVFTYVAGTATKQNSYTDSTGTTPNTNPVVLDSRGEASIWLDESLDYKVVLAPTGDTDPPGSPIWTIDGITSQSQDVLGKLAATSGGALVGTEAPESGGVPETVNIWIQRERVRPEQFGAVAGLASDNSGPLFNAAKAASARGVPLNLGGRTYRYDNDSNLFVPLAGLELENGYISMAAAPANAYILHNDFSAGTPISVTSPLTGGSSYQVQLTSTATLAIGQDVIIESTDKWSTAGNVTLGEWATIASIDSSVQITLTQPVRDSYSTSVQLRLPTLCDHLILTNAHLIGAGNGQGQSAASLQYIRRVVVNDSDTRLFAARGFEYGYCQSVEVDGGRPGQGDDTTGLSYGHVGYGATLSMKFRNVVGDRLRHVITCGGTTGVVRGYRVDGITGTSMTDATVDAHPAVDDFKAYDVKHVGDVNAGGADGDGFVSQARDTLLDGFTISGPGRHGVLVQFMCTAQTSVAQVGKGTVRNHSAKVSYTGVGVYFDLTTAGIADVDRAYVDDVDIESASAQAAGFLFQTSAGSLKTGRIGGCRVKVPQRALSLDAHLVAGKTISDFQVQGGYYERTNTNAAECVMFQGNSSGDVDNFKFIGAHTVGGDYGFRALNAGTHYSVAFNHFSGWGTAATNGISDNGTTQYVQFNDTTV